MKKSGLLILFLMCCCVGYAQDTTALIKEYNKVMAFAVQPYVYYSVSTKLSAKPVIHPQDTMQISGVFYKKENDLYFKNGADEVFLQDSLYIEINDQRKSILLSRVDVSTKKNISLSPLDGEKMRELFRTKYSVSRGKAKGKYASLLFESRDDGDSSFSVSTRVSLDYVASSYLPAILRTTITVRQAADDESLEQLKALGYEGPGLLEQINDITYLVRNQGFEMTFNEIDITKEKAQKIPVWQDRISYDKDNDSFIGRGALADYEVSKTF